MCRHDRTVLKSDCMNCDRDLQEFNEWWKDRLPKDDPQYEFAKSAWLAAIRYLEREEFF